MTIPYQFLSHLNNGPCMKKNQPASLQKTNLVLHVPVWILISWNELYLISQSELNDLVRDFSLSKIQAELLVSRLQGRNLLQQGVEIVVFVCTALLAIG